jgi:periplasmic protein TonB
MASPGRLIWATGGSVAINGALLALLVLTLPKSATPLRDNALWVSLETMAQAQTERATAEQKPTPPVAPAAPQPVVASTLPAPAKAEAPAVPQQTRADALAQMAAKDSKPSDPGPPAANPNATPPTSRSAFPAGPAQSQSQAQPQTAIPSEGSKHVASYAARVRAHIESFKVYPPLARRRHQTGVVSLTFTIDRQGRVLSAQITKSSGNPVLDQAALDMLSAAQPLPKPPSHLPGESLRMTSSAEFGLTD